MLNEQWYNIAISDTSTNAHRVTRKNATIKLLQVANDYGLELGNPRLTKNGFVNVGDIAELVLKGLKKVYNEQQVNVIERSLENKKDDYFKHFPIEYKCQTSTAYQASFTVKARSDKRYIGLRYNNKKAMFEVVYFTRQQANLYADAKNSKLNLKNIEDERDTLTTTNELKINDYLEFLQNALA